MSDPLDHIDHRPWPLPTHRPWVMHMRWSELLFAHWPVPVDAMRAAVPAALPLDTFEGRAYVGIVPFVMEDVRPRLVPPVPGVSRFLELNVRTYVTVGGKPGVFFFSLDAASRLAVATARRLFHLPYFNARMALEGTPDGGIDYRSVRTHRGADPVRFTARYGPTGEAYRAAPGALEHFLTERYALYTLDDDGHVLRADVHHAPWPLQPAAAEITANTLLAPTGLTLPDQAPLLHFARYLDVVAWLPERTAEADQA